MVTSVRTLHGAQAEKDALPWDQLGLGAKALAALLAFLLGLAQAACVAMAPTLAAGSLLAFLFRVPLFGASGSDLFATLFGALMIGPGLMWALGRVYARMHWRARA